MTGAASGRAADATSLLPGRRFAPVQLGRVLVLGLGVSGRACSEYLLGLLGDRVESLVVAAGPSREEAMAWAQGAMRRGASVVFDSEGVEGVYDLCIASPGISEFSDFYRSAAAVSGEIVSEVEFAWRESALDARWVAVTGTNGKTTTTALVEHLLRTAGMDARAVGNIGDTCIEAVAQGGAEVYVAEVSSYQLASTVRFAPDVAVVLNITPDHETWHRGHENYVAAKWKVLRRLGAGARTALGERGVAVLDATDEAVRAKVREIKALSEEERGYAYLPLGTAQGLTGDMRRSCGSENAAFVDGEGVLHVALRGEETLLASASDLQIKGAHNVSNALAAAGAALALGARADAVREGLASFAPIAHRIEPAGIVGGVAFFNDSKATNVDAVLKALDAFDGERPLVLLGGRDKGTDLAPLVEACGRIARAVVCFGEAQERFATAFRDAPASLHVAEAAGLADAFAEACALARPGDVVLLSPACASFDEFSCFEERGDAFKALVARAAARGPELGE